MALIRCPECNGLEYFGGLDRLPGRLASASGLASGIFLRLYRMDLRTYNPKPATNIQLRGEGHAARPRHHGSLGLGSARLRGLAIITEHEAIGRSVDPSLKRVKERAERAPTLASSFSAPPRPVSLRRNQSEADPPGMLPGLQPR
jgi:hypothetical protein